VLVATRLARAPLPHGSPQWQQAARRAKRLSWLSLLYMGVEGATAVTAAALAGSVARLGFGIDSVIEALASIIIVWRFTGSHTLSETAERRAQIGVAVSFWLLAPYIAYDTLPTTRSTSSPPVTTPRQVGWASASPRSP
jgi:hypothetical protein